MKQLGLVLHTTKHAERLPGYAGYAALTAHNAASKE